MASHVRGYGGSNDWDPMREDFENSTYNAQYPDDDAKGGVQLDHCRLYMPQVPKDLTVEGLNSAFSKFGTLKEVHISRDPQKRYGLVTFETPGEAKLAMMKLNKAPPLNLIMYIAHKKKANTNRDNKYNNGGATPGQSGQSFNQHRTDVNDNRGKYNRRQEDISETNMNNLPDDHLSANDVLEPGLNVELQQLNLELERLKLQEAQMKCRHRIALLKLAEKQTSVQSERCILPDGKIVVRNVDRFPYGKVVSWSTDAEASGTDSLNIPGLQSFGPRGCVVCGAPARSYCARCGVTPYCSPKCQRRDWMVRHKAVCHNLARFDSAGPEPNPPVELESINAAKTPPTLRRPYSPDKQNFRRSAQKTEGHHSAGSDNSSKTYQRNPPFKNKPTRGNTRGGFNNRSIDRNHNGGPSRPPSHNATNKQLPDDDEEWPVTNKTQQEPSKPISSQPIDEKPNKEHPKSIPSVIPASLVTEIKDGLISSHSVKSEVVKVAKEPSNVPQAVKIETQTEHPKLVPEHSVLDSMDIGDTCFLSVDNKASDCRVSRDGFVCVAINAQLQSEYTQLCGADYTSQCEASQEYAPTIGESFSYYCQNDEAWYRCRLVTSSSGALLDAGRLVTIDKSSKCRPLSGMYANIPEFCCLLEAENIKLGDDPLCRIKEKTPQHLVVTLEPNAGGQTIGEGKISRWLPDIDYPKVLPTPTDGAAPVNPQISLPEVPRPDLLNGSKVILVEATDANKAAVRPADLVAQKRYDSVLQDVVQYAANATPFSEPPSKGETVIAKYIDGLHYRAICKRTSVKTNRYMIEYIEFGNVEICKLEDLFPCPTKFNLQSRPTETSMIVFEHLGPEPFNQQATEYVDKLKDDAVELTLRLPSGGKNAPSGSEVVLTVVKTNENVNKKLKELCTPEWKKLEEKGGDVIETEVIMYKDLKHVEIQADNTHELAIYDVSMLEGGTISGHDMNIRDKSDKIKAELAEKMTEYVNSGIGREPYLPKCEELCIAQSPSDGKWYRAVMCEQPAGAGGVEANVCYVDYGNMEMVPVASLRKILAEFVVISPALAAQFEIKDFPKDPTADMILRAAEFMKIDDEGCGALRVRNIELVDQGLYMVEAPRLLAFIAGKDPSGIPFY